MPVKSNAAKRSSRRRVDPAADIPQPIVRISLALLEVFGRSVEKLGWAGTLVLLGFAFVVLYASPDQKHEIIDLFVLGKGLGESYRIILVAGFAILIVVSQYSFFRRREKVLRGEVERLSAWKSAYQEKHIKADLHHTKAVG